MNECRIVHLPHCNPLRCTLPRGHDGRCVLVVEQEGE